MHSINTARLERFNDGVGFINVNDQGLQDRINSSNYIVLLSEHFLSYSGQNLNSNTIFITPVTQLELSCLMRLVGVHEIPRSYWLAHSPNLNPVLENLRHYTNQQLSNRKFTKLEEIWTRTNQKCNIPLHPSFTANSLINTVNNKNYIQSYCKRVMIRNIN